MRPKEEEVAGISRKSHKERLKDLHCSVDLVVFVKTRRLEWAEHAAQMAGNGNACRYLEESIIKMRPFARPRNR